MNEREAILAHVNSIVENMKEDLYYYTDECDHTNMLLSEFKKYAPLFPHKEGVFGREYTKSELIELSNEYFNTISPYKNVHIIDDTTGEVVRILPKIFRKVTLLNTNPKNKEDYTETITDFNTMLDKANFEYQRDAALRNVIHGLVNKQDAETIKQEAIDYTNITNEFHEKNRNEKDFSDEEISSENIEKTLNNENETGVVFDGGFEPD